jgi:hypothetical protein
MTMASLNAISSEITSFDLLHANTIVVRERISRYFFINIFLFDFQIKQKLNTLNKKFQATQIFTGTKLLENQLVIIAQEDGSFEARVGIEEMGNFEFSQEIGLFFIVTY